MEGINNPTNGQITFDAEDGMSQSTDGRKGHTGKQMPADINPIFTKNNAKLHYLTG